jgi:restriction endonuclease S subunit
MDKIKELKVLYPIDIKEQENIANVLYGIDAIIQEEKAHRNKLINIKNGLLQDLLSGHVSAEPLS